jgi:hypothetical protein
MADRHIPIKRWMWALALTRGELRRGQKERERWSSRQLFMIRFLRFCSTTKLCRPLLAELGFQESGDQSLIPEKVRLILLTFRGQRTFPIRRSREWPRC